MDWSIVLVVALSMAAAVAGYVLGYHRASIIWQERLEQRVSQYRKMFEDAGIMQPSLRSRRMVMDEAQRSWTGLPVNDRATSPPGTALSWSDLPSQDRAAPEQTKDIL